MGHERRLRTRRVPEAISPEINVGQLSRKVQLLSTVWQVAAHWEICTRVEGIAIEQLVKR